MRKAIFLTVLILLVSVTFYVYWFYYNPKTDNGYKEGILQQFAHKGNVFKTYEGEMVLAGFGMRNGGVNANYFYFSVGDEKLADSLEHCLGKMVRLHYMKYRRNLPWRGDNYNESNHDIGQYIVDRIEEVKEANY